MYFPRCQKENIPSAQISGTIYAAGLTSSISIIFFTGYLKNNLKLYNLTSIKNETICRWQQELRQKVKYVWVADSWHGNNNQVLEDPLCKAALSLFCIIVLAFFNMNLWNK